MRQPTNIERKIARLLAIGSVLGMCQGCQGYIGGGAGEGPGPGATPGHPSPGGSGPSVTQACSAAAPEAPLRRLTRWEYDNTIVDLLGLAANAVGTFPPETSQFGFDNNVEGAVLSPRVVESYESSALRLAQQATQQLAALLGCDPQVAGEDACASSFISSFAKRAFRRPLRPEEQMRFEAFYLTSKTRYGFADAVRMFVQGVLQSPSFLYRVELGVAEPGKPDALRLSSWEMASRLSYLFAGSMPGPDLVTAAEADALTSPEQIRTQAERLLDSDAGARIMMNFTRQWASLHELRDLQKEDATYTSRVGELLELETETFVDQVVRRGEGTLAALLTAPYTYMNEELARFYGLGGTSTADLIRVELDPSRYSGLLTQAGLMARLAHPDQPSAVRRGQFVLEKLLCVELPPAPNDVDTSLPKPDPSATARQQLAQLTSVAPCGSCHTMLNPPGFAFEHFDALGRYRATDQGLAIDTKGTLSGSDVDGSFSDHLELGRRLSSSAQVRSCVVESFFRYAYGRDHADDSCSVEQLEAAFAAGNVRSLLLALTQTPAFLYRNDPTKEAL